MSDDLELASEKTQSSSWGGARPNPGPKPNAVKYKAKIAKATDIMGRMLPEAAAAVTDLATGAHIILAYNTRTKKWEKPRTLEIAQRAVDTDMYRVYQELPNPKAIEIMFERLMGKVPQPVDITVRQAVAEVTEAQAILMRVIEEHVPSEYLSPIREELERVAQHHSAARAAVSLD